ncbi:LysE family translocator [Mucilaginibacter sp. FT3.2]|uniref:LysE family translocator n=1 Tax=Mucilaginibacter sp. FT3.2 TaxID=2723090 RepID=UPI0017E1A7CD|nr:LysE family translocator [Mucilaginibacter sp. FT3.2]MBB6230523.1 threonine/homoserine/homoserine lactone efflux protein [Mucilaginibacter sp. FT3.2]
MNAEIIYSYFCVMGIINFSTFLITSLLFIMSPGIDTMFVLNKSIAQGKKAGIYATLGISTGVLVHTTLAAFGLSLILSQSAIAFSFMKYAGAAYLVYLGVTKFFSKDAITNQDVRVVSEPVRKTYLSAVLTNILNPKVAIFFLAFFPQFIQTAYIHNALPFVLLGVTYALMSLLWFMMLTFFAGSLSTQLKQRPTFGVWLNKFSAIVFVLMGIKIAFTKR